MIHQLTEKYCETVARRCKSVAEFFKRHHSAANKALKEGWYDSYTWLSRERVKRNTWTAENCREEARKYGRLAEFRKGSPTAYVTSCRLGIIGSFTWLERGLPKKCPWTEETVTELARQFSTKQEFRNAHNLAYHHAWEHGYLKKFTWLKNSPKYHHYLQK